MVFCFFSAFVFLWRTYLFFLVLVNIFYPQVELEKLALLLRHANRLQSKPITLLGNFRRYELGQRVPNTKMIGGKDSSFKCCAAREGHFLGSLARRKRIKDDKSNSWLRHWLLGEDLTDRRGEEVSISMTSIERIQKA